MVLLPLHISQWMIKYHKDLYQSILMGYIEVLTPEIQKEYLDWCKTYEGKQYLKNGIYNNENTIHI